MRIAIYPGSFDPVTNGHIDIIERAAQLFDRLVVSVAVSAGKNPLFSLSEREQMVREACGEFENVEVTSFDGLLVTHAKRNDAVAIVRGLRAVSDFELEFQLAQMNKSLSADIETVFVMTRTQWSYLSSRIVKEIAELGGCIDEFVPANVAEALARKFRGKVE